MKRNTEEAGQIMTEEKVFILVILEEKKNRSLSLSLSLFFRSLLSLSFSLVYKILYTLSNPCLEIVHVYMCPVLYISILFLYFNIFQVG